MSENAVITIGAATVSTRHATYGLEVDVEIPEDRPLDCGHGQVVFGHATWSESIFGIEDDDGRYRTVPAGEWQPWPGFSALYRADEGRLGRDPTDRARKVAIAAMRELLPEITPALRAHAIATWHKLRLERVEADYQRQLLQVRRLHDDMLRQAGDARLAPELAQREVRR